MSDPADVLAPSPTAAELTHAIRTAIIQGDYSPNQRLVEADLNAEYGASRSVIRTALLKLANDGLVDRLPNRGARVRAVTIDEAVEIFEVRIGLESLCASKAAERITDQQIIEMMALRAELLESAAAGDMNRYSELNWVLDERIRAISQHGAASTILGNVRAQSVRVQFRLAYQFGRAAISAPEHAEIIDAIASRDPEAASAATVRHLLGVIEAVRALA
ncbi:MAG: GntR family transcriptional regulator [Pseudolysinimonas sp.]